MSTANNSSRTTVISDEPRRRPSSNKAVPLRHPGRWITAAVLVILLAWFLISAAGNEAYGWDTYRQYIFDTRIAVAAGHTLLLTVLAMILGVVLGSIIAVLRMSPNGVLRGVSWLFLWVFRGTPVYVQLMFWGLLGSIYQVVNICIA